MKKTVIVFGLISGAISALLMLATVPFANHQSYIVGYTGIVLSFLLVFFGIRSYRDNVASGQITFAKAFAIGILITLISCVCYVVTWEIVYFNFLHGFMDKYFAHMIEKAKASGANPAAMQEQLQQIAKLQQRYENPFFNSLMTFMEPFPVGLAITLLSSAVLRKKEQSHPPQSPATAS